ncbi:hypothetical protein [Actinoplanes sp. NBRC 103695]|uniref:hypothetical protein n=1 Tax=Actinoplanes sp. NBRC 103695 TaxID=3032202 RepID=UPI002553F97C|nr:hypothetical protein [Actinoplanes sp. NBRC 103695]
MRRLVVSVLCASGLIMTGAGTAFAEEAPGGAAQAPAGKKVCKVTDEKLEGLSGIVATDDGFVVVNDSNPLSSRKRVFFLDAKCKITDDVPYSGKGPLDTEDMALSPDSKTLWIADIGDNDKKRETVGLWVMPATGKSEPDLYRLKYPDGAHDAEALLLNGDGTPIIVTKEVGKAAGVYVPAAKLKKNTDDGVPLKRVGEVPVPPSNTAGNNVARLGRGTIVGGAVSTGATKAVLRTYTDALEWTVTNGDVVGALKGKPRVTPLPNEPWGEAIAYSPDGKFFYTVNDMENSPVEGAANNILRYTPATGEAPVVKNAAGAETDKKTGPSWFQSLDLNDITYLVGGVGVLGLILVGVGIFGIRRHRRNAPPEPAVLKKKSGPDDGPVPADAATELLAVGGAASGPGVYGAGGAARGGGGPGGGGPGGPGVYGGKPAAGGPGVYGGGRPSAGAGAGRPAAAGRPVAGAAAGRPPAGGGQRPPAGAGPRPPAAGGRPPVVNGRPGGGRPAAGGAPQGGRPVSGGAPGVRPASGGAPGGRPVPGGAPGGRPAAGGAPGGRPASGGAPGGRPASGGAPAPGGRPASGGAPQGGRPAQGGGRPPQGGGRPPQGGQPRPPQGGQPRPAQGGQPRPPQGGQPRPPRPPQGGQPRPPQGGGRPPQGGQPRPPQANGRPTGGGSGVYGGGAPPSGGRSRDVDDDQNYGRTYGR